MVPQLQPWRANLAKRQVKAPKIYLRDSGLLHRLFGLDGEKALLSHPKVGASWEGFVIEQAFATEPIVNRVKIQIQLNPSLLKGYI